MGSNQGTVAEGKASGDVEGENWVGGLVGNNQGEVAEAKASGDVKGAEGEARVDTEELLGADAVEAFEEKADEEFAGNSGVGGFVGRHSSDASIAHSYSTGAVDGDEDVGGFAGDAETPDSIDSAYWNIDASGLDTSAGGVGLTAEEFGDRDSFEGFVFCPDENCRWVMDDDKRQPVLEAFK